MDPSAGELYRDGERIHLQEHPRQVIVALLERPGEIVTRDDLRERLWKSDRFVDFEHGLNTAVKKARQALGDSAEAPEFIETLARRGYRFIGRVEPLEPAGADVTGSPAETALPSSARRATSWARRPVLWAAALLLLVVGAVAIWFAQRTADQQESPGTRQAATARLAVMPFRVLAESGSDSAYLGVGSRTQSPPGSPIRGKSRCGLRRRSCRSTTRSPIPRASRHPLGMRTRA